MDAANLLKPALARLGATGLGLGDFPGKASAQLQKQLTWVLYFGKELKFGHACLLHCWRTASGSFCFAVLMTSSQARQGAAAVYWGHDSRRVPAIH